MKLSHSDMICEIASRIEGEFSASELVVAVWQAYPEVFGLEGFKEKYPSENKILAYLMGVGGLVQRGRLKRVGKKRYISTGWCRGEKATAGPKEGSPYRIVNTDLEGFLGRIYDSQAYSKFVGGSRDDITLVDCLAVLWIDTDMKGSGVRVQVNRVKADLLSLEKVDQDIKSRSGQIFTPGDVRMIKNLFSHLFDKYDSRLKLMEIRK